MFLAGSFAPRPSPMESPEPARCPLWWSWTAPASGPVLVQVKQGWADRLSVFTGQAEEALSLVTEMPIGWKRYATFAAVAGTEYQFRATARGRDHSPIKIAVGLESLPMLLEQPVTQAVFPGEALFFGVAAAVRDGSTNTFQWQYNGFDLPGETQPVLELTNALARHAGEYRAVVTAHLADGATVDKTSSVARLQVSAEVTPPTLVLRKDPLAADSLILEIQGDEGRSYSMVSGRSFLNDERNRWGWRPEALPRQVSTIWAKSQFMSAQVYRAPNSVCIMNLEKIRFAQERWAADLNKPLGATFVLEDLRSYIRLETLQCSDGGNYTDNVGFTSGTPACVIVDHIPRDQ